MFEKKFLAYVLYVTLLEIRESALTEKNWRVYHLTDILHNVPGSLLDGEEAKEEYKRLLRAVEQLKIDDWLNKRMNEFKERFPDLLPR